MVVAPRGRRPRRCKFAGMARPQAPPVEIRRWSGGGWAEAGDEVAAEEPLQLLLDGEPLSIVMRTPGHDAERLGG